MSLINDALKQAKQTQEQNPPPTPPLQFRPVEPGQPYHTRTPFVVVGLALALILVVVLGGLLVWFVSQKSAGELRVSAKTVNEPAPTVPAVVIAEPETNALPVAAPAEPPEPLVPKLQGITFHPTRPLAVLNDRTVLIGDRVGGFRVLAITRRSVTLGSDTATNVLSLSE
jgi:hypothetical protein